MPVDDRYGYKELMEGQIVCYCNRLEVTLRKTRDKCRYFKDIQLATLIIGGDGVVKLSTIPTEAERIDLKDLPKEVELMAIGEKMQEARAGSTGGLVITFKMRDGRTFPQKYSPVSGAVLVRAMKDLKIKDTEDLQKGWYKYELTAMRIGLPRMIPVSKVE